MLRLLLAAFCAAALATAPVHAASKKKRSVKAAKTGTALVAAGAANGYDAEARLIQVYQTIGQSRTREALLLADKLVADFPHFALAQLVHGDLLMAQSRPLKMLGDVPEATLRAAPGVLGELREESLLRMKALRETPPADMLPEQFARLSARNKHAIAIDASRARLYLFENTSSGLRMIANYYMSVGKQGIEKTIEGDLRTPLGVYFITNTLDRKNLKDFYGAGALPINYPNPYDTRRGKTGSGIWLHGTPPAQVARPPKATDGCVVLANPDLERILATVEMRTTPVVIAPSLKWVKNHQNNADLASFDAVWQQWQQAYTQGDIPRTMAFYTPDFNSYGKTLADWQGLQSAEASKAKGRAPQIKDQSALHWVESANSATMVVTFSQSTAGSKTSVTKRQYWLRSAGLTQNQWKMFFEGVIG